MRSKNTGGGCENERNEKLHEQIKMQKLFQAFAVVCTVAVAEERLRAEDMGGYWRVRADTRDLNYDKFTVGSEVRTQADDSYTSHNTERLDVAATVEKIKTAEYVREALGEGGAR